MLIFQGVHAICQHIKSSNPIGKTSPWKTPAFCDGSTRGPLPFMKPLGQISASSPGHPKSSHVPILNPEKTSFEGGVIRQNPFDLDD